MAVVNHAVAGLNRIERDVLIRLRDAFAFAMDSTATGNEEDSPFVPLALHLRRRAIAIRDPAVPYVGVAEFRVLALLAIVQRENVLNYRHWRTDLRDSLIRAGYAFKALGLKLPHSAITRITRLPPDAPDSPDAVPECIVLLFPAGAAPPANHLVSARGRALALARTVDRATPCDFGAIGVSRRTLLQLCREGLLHRDLQGNFLLAAQRRGGADTPPAPASAIHKTAR
jgi:hypothetical protein